MLISRCVDLFGCYQDDLISPSIDIKYVVLLKFCIFVLINVD